MMKSKLWRLTLSIVASAFISACAVQGTPPPAFKSQPIAGGKWQQKADCLYFILDASSSMAEHYKFETARSVIANFNETMPVLNLTVALRSFGHDPSVSSKLTELLEKPQPYKTTVLPEGLAKVTKAGGTSPLDRAIRAAAEDLKGIKGSIALVIISDGKDMADETPVAAAEDLSRQHPGNLCIYTVQVGNSAEGSHLLSSIAKVTDCGKAVSAESLATGAAMNAFVKDVLLAGIADSDGDGVADDVDRCPNTPAGVKVDQYGCPLDSDKDGVPDYKDQCPDTPAGTKVDAKGCPQPVPTLGKISKSGTYVFNDIQFETNKADLKASSYTVLNNIVEALKANPDLKVEIQGYTDNTGKYDYNVGLSQRRANAVKVYLESNGIQSSRLTAAGYGPDNPIASNKTREGRAKNRRVEFKPIP